MAEKYESFETYLIKHISEQLPDLSQPVYAEVSKVFYEENVGGVLYQFEFEFPSIDDMPLKKSLSGKDIPDFKKISNDTIIKVQRVFPNGEVIVDYSFNVLGKGGDVEALNKFNKILTEGKGMKGVLLDYYDTFPVETTLPTTLDLLGDGIPDTPEGIVDAVNVTDEAKNIFDDTLERLRNANDKFVDQQLDDIMAQKINEILPFVNTDLSKAEAVGIRVPPGGPEITKSKDPVLNAFADELGKYAMGDELTLYQKRKLWGFMWSAATNDEYGLINEKKSFLPVLRDGVDASKLDNTGYLVWKNLQNFGTFRPEKIIDMTANEFAAFGPPPYVRLLEGLDKEHFEKTGEYLFDYKGVSEADVIIPESITDNWIDNYTKTTTSFIDSLPLENQVKNQFDNLVKGRAKNLATPGGVMDAVDAWELGVLGLMIAAVAYKEYDEIPKILTNKAVDMFNSMTAPYNIPPVPKEQYDLDYEFINKVVETGEKFMPTDIIIKKVGEVIEGVGEKGLATGFGYVPTTPKKTDTMETKQKIQPGVQENKMFEQVKKKENLKQSSKLQYESQVPKQAGSFEKAVAKSKSNIKPKKGSGGGSGSRIL